MKPLSDSPVLTFSAAFEHFLARSRFAARTRESYAQDLAPLLTTLGMRPLSTLDAAAAAAFLATQEQLASSTYNRRLAALRSFVHWCLKQGWLIDDPLQGVVRRSQPRRVSRALDPEQVEAILRTIRDVRDCAFF